MVIVTEDLYNYEVSWELSCDGLPAPITGGSPYSATHAVPPGSCSLVLMDSFGDGWQGAAWSAPGWTEQNFTLASGYNETVSFYAGPQPPSPPRPPPPPPRPPLTCGPGTEENSESGQCEISCAWGRRTAEEGAAEEDALEPSPGKRVRQLMDAYVARHPGAAAMSPEVFALMESGLSAIMESSLSAISSLSAHPEAAMMMESMSAELFLQPAPA